MSTLGAAALLTSGCAKDDPVSPEIAAEIPNPGTVDSAAVETGTTIYPGQSIQAKVNSYPAGTTFQLKAGVHRLQGVTPKTGNSFIGESGAILSGARVLGGWTSSGGRWVVEGQTQENRDHDTRLCLPDHPGCNLPEQLWVDGALQKRTTSLSAVAPGKWYFDYAANRIYLGVNPSGKVVETSVTPQAFGGRATDVTIRSLVIEQYATGTGNGTIDARSGWTIDAVDVGHSHGTCIRVSGNGVRIRGSRAHHCGEQGIGGPAGTGLVVEGTEIAYNNTAGFGPGGGSNKAAGLKVSHTVGMVIRGNHVHHNPIGLWCDVNCVDAVFDGNRVEDNGRRGIQYEISYGCKVLNNTVRRNGTEESGPSAAGIWIAQSSDCEVHHNTLEGNNVAIMGSDRDRGSGTQGTYRLIGLSVHDNRISQLSGLAGGVNDQSSSRDPYTSAANNRYESNAYTVGSGTRWLWTNNKTLTQAQWQAAGHDHGN